MRLVTEINRLKKISNENTFWDTVVENTEKSTFILVHLDAGCHWVTPCKNSTYPMTPQAPGFTWQSKTSQIAKLTGPTWGPPRCCRPQMDPVLAPWTSLSGVCCKRHPSWILRVTMSLESMNISTQMIVCTLSVKLEMIAICFTVARLSLEKPLQVSVFLFAFVLHRVLPLCQELFQVIDLFLGF